MSLMIVCPIVAALTDIRPAGATEARSPKSVDSLNCHLGTSANLVDSRLMTMIVFRRLPAVAAVEQQLRLQSRGLLADDEA